MDEQVQILLKEFVTKTHLQHRFEYLENTIFMFREYGMAKFELFETVVTEIGVLKERMNKFTEMEKDLRECMKTLEKFKKFFTDTPKQTDNNNIMLLNALSRNGYEQMGLCTESKDEPKQEPLQEDRWNCQHTLIDYIDIFISHFKGIDNNLIVISSHDNSNDQDILIFLNKQQVLSLAKRLNELAEEME